MEFFYKMAHWSAIVFMVAIRIIYFVPFILSLYRAQGGRET